MGLGNAAALPLRPRLRAAMGTGSWQRNNLAMATGSQATTRQAAGRGLAALPWWSRLSEAKPQAVR